MLAFSQGGKQRLSSLGVVNQKKHGRSVSGIVPSLELGVLLCPRLQVR